ncbi:MAG: molybdenum cofactor guanylyltransferase [Chloroflexota bacterium]
MISAAVLAGGSSERMGTDKSNLIIGGQTLLERAVEAALCVSSDVLVVGRSLELHKPGVRSVADLRPGWGALSGVFTALSLAHHERCLVLACDMPFVDWHLLRFLVALDTSSDVVVPRLGTLLEPLHAIYARSCLGPIQQLMAAGGKRIFDFFPKVRVRYVDASEMADIASLERVFLNVNTPADLQSALMLAENEWETLEC